MNTRCGRLKSYDVLVHFKSGGNDTYTVRALSVSGAQYHATMRINNECGQQKVNDIDQMHVYLENTDQVLATYSAAAHIPSFC